MTLQTLGKPIAQGLTAEIYAWDERRILKLFRDWCPPDRVEEEARIARAVHAAGLPVPAVGEMMEIDGRRSVIYERLEGFPLWDPKKPWVLVRSGRLLAELHADLHARSMVPELPSQREELEHHIRAAPMLPPDLQQAALRALEHMPTGGQLCHGDFHPGNVLMTRRGPMIIDWNYATRGNPLADVARSSVLLLGALSMPFPGWRKAIVRWVRMTYLRRYFQLRPGGQEQFKAWQPITAAARLHEKIPGLQPWLLATVEAGLSQHT